ncbi:hypothetical protein [Streptomyces sp. Ag109_O5-1]|uniref:hypothetical protein n=1 Tax=Streptomyces sp. Ag109_O5-1 TaxID=1938851 RepID=UPI001C85D7E6|nr:hypothetical protein [Streptomyces sp. Ag109_O5-1]
MSAEVKDGQELLVASLQIWLTNVIVFGLAYWELDRGGPVSRTQVPREELPLADFRFSQDDNDDAVQEVSDGSSKASDWVPTLMDYLYVPVTNSTAFPEPLAWTPASGSWWDDEKAVRLLVECAWRSSNPPRRASDV